MATGYIKLRNLFKEYSSIDGWKVASNKYHFSEDFSENYCSFKITINDNSINFHFVLEDHVGGTVINCEPFKFHIGLSNGINITFGPPLPLRIPVPPCDKGIATYEYYKNNEQVKRRSTIQIPSTGILTTSKQFAPSHHSVQSKISQSYSKPIIEDGPRKYNEDMENKTLVYIKKKKEFLNKIKTAIKCQKPIFKICSSPLHRYSYISRQKSRVEIPFGKVIKRFTIKPKIYKKPRRQLLITQCVPVVDLENLEIKRLDYDFKATLPTGLFIQACQGIGKNPVYIKQGYVIDRDDLQSLVKEDYRVCNRGSVISFLKNGEVMTMYFDKDIEIRQYGYFRSNVTETNMKKDQLRRMSTHSLNIHKATKNLKKFDKTLKTLCSRYNKHSIGTHIAYRLESKHDAVRKEKKICKLSKKLYRLIPSMLPLLKITYITQNKKVIIDTKNWHEEENKFFTTSYTDYLRRETLTYRQDGTVWFLHNDGAATTQFPDKTRITTWLSIIEEEYYVDLTEEEIVGEETFVDPKLLGNSSKIEDSNSKKIRSSLLPWPHMFGGRSKCVLLVYL